MSQEFNTTPIKRPKHISRTQRNRPVLVTESSSTEEQTLQQASSVESTDVPAENTPTEAKPKRRLPNFFSTIGKNNETGEDKAQADQAQARLARATRTPKSVTQSTKAISKTTTTPEKTKEKDAAKPATTTKPGAPTRPASAFKTKHIIGIAIYLLAANFVGIFEAAILNNLHLERTLTTFNLFGNKVTINASTVVFLITLIVILVVLAKLDFIPRSLGPTPPPRTSKSTASNNATAKTKTLPPTIRPGVKGENDQLYKEYVQSRRKRK